MHLILGVPQTCRVPLNLDIANRLSTAIGAQYPRLVVFSSSARYVQKCFEISRLS